MQRLLKGYSFLQKTVLGFLILCVVTFFYTGQEIVFYMRFGNDFKCHQSEEKDVLPSAENINFSPEANSIFFHETSCRSSLSERQACAIESAARIHPNKQIYVLFSSPVSEDTLRNSSLAKLSSYMNINFARVHIAEYARNTPLEELIANKEFYKSMWWVELTSDVLRSLTLYKWGGVYLDMDMLVVKSLTSLGNNWVAKEIPVLVNGAAIAISMDRVGRKLINAILDELKITYRPDIWAHNGPGAITRVLHKLCNTHHMAEWSPATCGGLDVYGPEYFFPVHYSDYQVYFQPGELEGEEKNAYAYHLWNKLTYNLTAEKGSPLLEMAEKFCPTIFQTYGDKL